MLGTGLSYLLGFINQAAWIWLVWVILFALATLVMVRNNRRHLKAPGHIGQILGLLWSGIGAAYLICVACLTIVGSCSLGIGLAVGAVFLGLGYLVSGAVSGIRWLRNLAAVWFLAAPGMVLLPQLVVPGFFACLVLLVEVLPGFLLRAAYRKKTYENLPTT